jgi:hypothetical protein
MTATIKSHVLRRDEKGMFGVPFKRILLVLMAGGMSYSVLKLFMGEIAWVVAIGVAVATLVLSAPHGGIPRYQRLIFGIRSNLMIGAHHSPDGLAGHICQLLDLPVDEVVVLDGEQLFKMPDIEVDDENALNEWEFFSSPDSARPGAGFAIVSAPQPELSLITRPLPAETNGVRSTALVKGQ